MGKEGYCFVSEVGWGSGSSSPEKLLLPRRVRRRICGRKEDSRGMGGPPFHHHWRSDGSRLSYRTTVSLVGSRIVHDSRDPFVPELLTLFVVWGCFGRPSFSLRLNRNPKLVVLSDHPKVVGRGWTGKRVSNLPGPWESSVSGVLGRCGRVTNDSTHSLNGDYSGTSHHFSFRSVESSTDGG